MSSYIPGTDTAKIGRCQIFQRVLPAAIVCWFAILTGAVKHWN
ncbi:hypothetical protein ACK9YZ_12535 [Rhizobium sp. ZK1]|jgi:hypothetical protein